MKKQKCSRSDEVRVPSGATAATRRRAWPTGACPGSARSWQAVAGSAACASTAVIARVPCRHFSEAMVTEQARRSVPIRMGHPAGGRPERSTSTSGWRSASHRVAHRGQAEVVHAPLPGRPAHRRSELRIVDQPGRGRRSWPARSSTGTTKPVSPSFTIDGDAGHGGGHHRQPAQAGLDEDAGHAFTGRPAAEAP